MLRERLRMRTYEDRDTLEAETASTVHARGVRRLGEDPFLFLSLRLYQDILTPLHRQLDTRPTRPALDYAGAQLSTKRAGSTLGSRLDFRPASILHALQLYFGPGSSTPDACLHSSFRILSPRSRGATGRGGIDRPASYGTSYSLSATGSRRSSPVFLSSSLPQYRKYGCRDLLVRASFVVCFSPSFLFPLPDSERVYSQIPNLAKCEPVRSGGAPWLPGGAGSTRGTTTCCRGSRPLSKRPLGPWRSILPTLHRLKQRGRCVHSICQVQDKYGHIIFGPNQKSERGRETIHARSTEPYRLSGAIGPFATRRHRIILHYFRQLVCLVIHERMGKLLALCQKRTCTAY
ncbi:hypothetical protein C8F04DRAFT_1406927, partial [Mycena alexandri]